MKFKLLALGLLFSTSAFAVTGTGMINIQLQPSCTIENAVVDLGNYTPETARVIAAPIKHECSTGVTYKIKVSDSNQMNGNIRHLPNVDNNVNDTFQYQLYKNSAKEHWGNADSDSIIHTGTGNLETSQIFIETLPNQFITPGVYKDTLRMTLTY